ncbi:MAG: hypothetical protein HFH73_04405 [Lachnospiraceae bacterium]|jgi:ppGpp synthetase/RelA/SpoT-type nucleotidyltranferase|nr:hypothetical protein [Lachnospiraceae bacterium]
MNHFEMELEQLEAKIESDIDFEKLTELCEHLKDAVKEILDSCGIYFRIFSRVKSVHSIAEKIKRGNYGTEINPKKIQDLVGLRVVLYYYDDLSICRDITESTFQMIDDWSRPKYSADEFRATKINGVFRFPTEYFNLYKKELWKLPIDTTFEIQFRTVFFEGWHEIEHDMRYKSFLSDDEFWKGSEELSRVLNCILANLELSDWSLIQLFDQLSYNHYKRGNWELMLKSKYRIKISDTETLDPRIVEVFDRNRNVAKQFFKGSRKHFIKELLKLDNPHVNYNLIVMLMNNLDVHNEEIAAICDTITLTRDDRVYQKHTFTRLESNILFQLELPLLHKETRLIETEFNNAAMILYKWARFKLNPVFEDMPAEISSYKNSLPGYQLKITYHPEKLSFTMKLQHIDAKAVGTLWHLHASIALMDDGLLHFYHITSRDMPRGISQRSTFIKPSFLADLSNKIGIVDVARLSNKAQFVTKDEQLSSMIELVQSAERKLPVVVIAQHTRDLGSDNPAIFRDYDMNTFTVNGTRLAKVVGHYCHVMMLDYEMIADFAYAFQLLAEDIHGCICIFWPNYAGKSMELFTRKMVIDTQFDFNRFAFHDDNISEKAFRHKLVQMIKNNNVSR